MNIVLQLQPHDNIPPFFFCTGELPTEFFLSVKLMLPKVDVFCFKVGEKIGGL